MKELSAGGVVFRHQDDGLELLLIEDRYGHWTLPKGKQEPNETNEQTALREIWEETRIEGEVLQPLTSVAYQYEHEQYGTVEKVVHYFLVRQISGQAQPQLTEINRVTWLSPKEAWQRQQTTGYRNNDEVIQRALKLLDQTGHNQAGKDRS